MARDGRRIALVLGNMIDESGREKAQHAIEQLQPLGADIKFAARALSHSSFCSAMHTVIDCSSSRQPPESHPPTPFDVPPARFSFSLCANNFCAHPLACMQAAGTSLCPAPHPGSRTQACPTPTCANGPWATAALTPARPAGWRPRAGTGSRSCFRGRCRRRRRHERAPDVETPCKQSHRSFVIGSAGDHHCELDPRNATGELSSGARRRSLRNDGSALDSGPAGGAAEVPRWRRATPSGSAATALTKWGALKGC